LSTDGTSDRQQHYQSTWCTIKLEDGSVERHFLGLRRLADHTSETQLNDLTDVITAISDYWNRSPLGSMSPIALSDVLRVMRGTNLDHAADMKKLNRLLGELKQKCDRIERGKASWANLDYLASQARCAQVIDSVVEENGGTSTFYALPDTEQAELLAEGYNRMWHQLGEEEFAKLSPAQQATVDLWFWFGCMMHKELNVIKAGCVGMERVRDDFDLVQPMKWLKKDNEAAAKSGSAELKARAERESRSGGAKLGISMASFLRNKHHEKGVQRGWNDYAIEIIGRSTPCPDAGRVRFHTTTGVCEFILANYHHLIAFMDLHYYSKKQPGFNNFEQNIYNALHDLPTLTDVAVLAVVHQTMSIPYASSTRDESLNAIDLGPLHVAVKDLCRRIADDPSLVLQDPATSHLQCALGSQPYQSPETLSTIRRFYDADLLPDFELVLSGFMMDAVAKWDDFTEEFASSGPLAHTSSEDLDLVFFPSTNDCNEGTLGQARCAHRHKPNISDAMLSATLSYKHNALESSMALLSPADHAFVWQEARKQAQKSGTRISSAAAVAHLQQVATERKARKEARESEDAAKAQTCAVRCNELEIGGRLLLDPNAAWFMSPAGAKTITCDQIRSQLEWHQARGLPEGHVAKVLRLSGNKSEILARWRAALVAYADWIID